MQEKIKTTYLELCNKDQFTPKKGYRDRIGVMEADNDIYLNFILFTGVGLPWSWYSRFRWTKKDWDNYFSSGVVKTYLGFENTTLIGYFELGFEEKNVAEIKLFGLFPQYLGRGLGGMLLSYAVDIALANDVNRIWLHTCSKDSKTAAGNYLARGFSIFREKEEFENVPEKSDILRFISDFYSGYIDRFTNLKSIEDSYPAED